jgi:hypothetical protein
MSCLVNLLLYVCIGTWKKQLEFIDSFEAKKEYTLHKNMPLNNVAHKKCSTWDRIGHERPFHRDRRY